jgi:hypothetical protein
MPIKSLIRETVSLQGFRVESIDRFSFGIGIKIAPDYRFNPRCGKCGKLGKYRDSRNERQFKHVPIWVVPVMLSYSPRRVYCTHCKGIPYHRHYIMIRGIENVIYSSFAFISIPNRLKVFISSHEIKIPYISQLPDMSDILALIAYMKFSIGQILFCRSLPFCIFVKNNICNLN